MTDPKGLALRILFFKGIKILKIFEKNVDINVT